MKNTPLISIVGAVIAGIVFGLAVLLWGWPAFMIWSGLALFITLIAIAGGALTHFQTKKGNTWKSHYKASRQRPKNMQAPAMHYPR